MMRNRSLMEVLSRYEQNVTRFNLDITNCFEKLLNLIRT